MKIAKKHLVILLAVLSMGLSSCNSWVYDSTSGCDMGVYVHLYSKTPCATDTIYPTTITDYSVFVFDEQSRLAAIKRVKKESLDSDNKVQIPLLTPGLYSVIAWAGITPELVESQLKLGKTHKKDVFLKLKDAEAISLPKSLALYVGLSEPFLVGYGDDTDTYKETSVNLRELSNRIQVSIEDIPDAEKYQVSIESMNGTYSLLGEVIKDKSINYQPYLREVGDDSLTESFSLLKLVTGHNSVLTIKRDEEVLYQEDLLGTILLKNPMVNLKCDNDFSIRFKVRESCACVEIWVNDWLIHSYETEVGPW